MESNSNSNEKLVELLDQVINLLTENAQDQWAGFLQNAKKNFIETDDKNKAIEPIIKSMLGGMGSLSDVVLHKNGKPLIKENNELYNLLNNLYDECKKLKNNETNNTAKGGQQ